jgi:hypothetical protein
MNLRFVRFASLSAAGLAFLLGVATPAPAIDNGDELGCQLGTSLTIGKFIREKGLCIANCQKLVFGGSGNPADCVPPYGGSTSGCVTSSEAQAGGSIQSSCAQDCPECYSGGDCQVEADAAIADAEADVEALAAEVFCDDSASGDGLTLSEFKCQHTVRKFITHFAAAKLKCFAKCRKGEFSGKVSAGACAQPTSDPKTQDCINKVETKTAFVLDKKCESAVNPSADKPECGPYPVRDGAAWVAAEEAVVDAGLPELFCNDTTTTTTTTLP